MGRLPGLESGEEFPSIQEVRNEIWEIPVSFLFHPISMEDVCPDLPQVITVEVDKYRDRITRPDTWVCALVGLTGQDVIDESTVRVTYVGEDPDDDDVEDDPDYEEEDEDEDLDDDEEDSEDMEEYDDEDEDEDNSEDSSPVVQLI
jgi:hypothetical protein